MRLPNNDAAPPGHDRRARKKDAGSTNSSAIRATEDVVSRRLACLGGRGFVVRQPLKLASRLTAVLARPLRRRPPGFGGAWQCGGPPGRWLSATSGGRAPSSSLKGWGALSSPAGLATATRGAPCVLQARGRPVAHTGQSRPVATQAQAERTSNQVTRIARPRMMARPTSRRTNFPRVSLFHPPDDQVNARPMLAATRPRRNAHDTARRGWGKGPKCGTGSCWLGERRRGSNPPLRGLAGTIVR